MENSYINYNEVEDLEYCLSLLKKRDELIYFIIDYIKKNCIDDEFYCNLSNKEKAIIDLLTLLQNRSDYF